MSIFGSLFTGVSALSAQSQSMGMISNNIANVNTVGYKRDIASFSSLITSAGRSVAYSPGGVRASAIGTVDKQGSFQQTGSTSDIGISGAGFFAVKREDSESDVLYTRAGSFARDKDGYLRNSSNYVLQGWQLDSAGNLPSGNADLSSLTSVNLSFLGGLNRSTSTVSFAANLKAGETTANTYQKSVTIYDSLGTPQELKMTFTKAAGVGAWTVTPEAVGGTPTFTATTLQFGTDGTLTTPASGQLAVNSIVWGNGSATQSINVDLSSLTQYSSGYSVIKIDQNGAELGLFNGINVDKDGFVIANFSNGLNSRIYKLPLVTFANANGLDQQSGNAYSQTAQSGNYNLREAGQGGSGQIVPSALEVSNVDLADEFSKMIVTQRAYSAGAKVITTADQMLQELLQIR